TVVLVISWVLVLIARGGDLQLGALSRRTWVFLILSGVATGLSWLCYFRALQLGPASKVAPIDKLSVVFVLVFAAMFLREPVTWTQCVGGALILIGAVILAV
ncbi:MAG: rane protein, partial [Verrucomicrobiales bacterium]|nr:rane protein [Verrucomicrobiales bacterium]